MKKLVQGIVEFRENALADYRERFAKLTLGQSPDALFIACCDSRVEPSVFVSTDPGDLFMVRNIGNLVPPHDEANNHEHSVAAAIEFALTTLNVTDIIICGHSECAAMQYFTQQVKPDLTEVKSWLHYATPSYERFKEIAMEQSVTKFSPHNQLSQINTIQQIQHLKTYPEVKKRIENNTLKVHAWWFELNGANVYYYDNEENDFLLIDAAHAERATDRSN